MSLGCHYGIKKVPQKGHRDLAHTRRLLHTRPHGQAGPASPLRHTPDSCLDLSLRFFEGKIERDAR